ncbi:alginate export family protein [Roseateles sp. PN1]
MQTDPVSGQRIESIQVLIKNPSADTAFNGRVEDLVRRTIAVFPSDVYSELRLLSSLARISLMPEIQQAKHEATPGATGGVLLTIEVTLAERGAAGKETPAAQVLPAFPTLYESNGTVVRAKLETLAMYYGNNNAWFGRNDVMLNGNPFAVGQSAGKGYSDWLEGFVHLGLYGITPISPSIYTYGGISALASGSVGQELFTDKTRSHLAVEDAFVGIVGGTTSEQGDRFVYNLSTGRQRFTIGEGFLLVNTAANGLNRAALQSNPRWAGDRVTLGRFAFNNWKLDLFHVEPDEMPELDSKTQIQGVNLEASALGDFNLGFTALHVPKSKSVYYKDANQLPREGLRVADMRMRWQPAPAGKAGPFVAAELARQTHSKFDMEAWAYFGELGYVFAQAPWTPTLSYRYARFSGDQADSQKFGRWDPLLSGGNGETWVQGINHYKIFQDSNLVAHRIQMRLRPQQQIELVPQLWFFSADSLTNLGGNPALSFLKSKNLGTELNLTAKYFMSRNVMFQGHIAATFAGDAIKQGLGTYSSPWISTMFFVRIGY